MGGNVCGKQGLCVQSQQLRVTSLKAAASRSLRGRRRERAPPAKQLQLVLRRKTAAKQHLLLSHSPLGCQMLPLVRCHGIHCTIPSWYNRWTPGPKTVSNGGVLFRLTSYRRCLLCWDRCLDLLKLQFLSNCETLRQGGVGLPEGAFASCADQEQLARKLCLSAPCRCFSVFVCLQPDLCFGLSAYNKLVTLAHTCVVCFQVCVICN